MSDDSNSEQSHTNAAATKIITRIGSWAMVMVNMASAGPNARKAQPKNSGKVIVSNVRRIYCDITKPNKKPHAKRCFQYWR